MNRMIALMAVATFLCAGCARETELQKMEHESRELDRKIQLEKENAKRHEELSKLRAQNAKHAPPAVSTTPTKKGFKADSPPPSQKAVPETAPTNEGFKAGSQSPSQKAAPRTAPAQKSSVSAPWNPWPRSPMDLVNNQKHLLAAQRQMMIVQAQSYLFNLQMQRMQKQAELVRVELIFQRMSDKNLQTQNEIQNKMSFWQDNGYVDTVKSRTRQAKDLAEESLCMGPAKGKAISNLKAQLKQIDSEIQLTQAYIESCH